MEINWDNMTIEEEMLKIAVDFLNERYGENKREKVSRSNL